jgi:hypothetical protein
MMKVNSKVMVTTVPPDWPLAYTRRPIFVSASAHPTTFLRNFITAVCVLCCYFFVSVSTSELNVNVWMAIILG